MKPNRQTKTTPNHETPQLETVAVDQLDHVAGGLMPGQLGPCQVARPYQPGSAGPAGTMYVGC